TEWPLPRQNLLLQCSHFINSGKQNPSRDVVNNISEQNGHTINELSYPVFGYIAFSFLNVCPTGTYTVFVQWFLVISFSPYLGFRLALIYLKVSAGAWPSSTAFANINSAGIELAAVE
ncbi:hypothetical protein LCGC14_2270840, partial [marine sediment metagenome]